MECGETSTDSVDSYKVFLHISNFYQQAVGPTETFNVLVIVHAIIRFVWSNEITETKSRGTLITLHLHFVRDYRVFVPLLRGVGKGGGQLRLKRSKQTPSARIWIKISNLTSPYRRQMTAGKWFPGKRKNFRVFRPFVLFICECQLFCFNRRNGKMAKENVVILFSTSQDNVIDTKLM